jgi:hypothetical protein
MYAIESGIPVIERRSAQKAKAQFPYHTMKVGDSFLIPVKESTWGQVEKQRVLALLTARSHKITVATRKVDNGIRVWKIRKNGVL